MAAEVVYIQVLFNAVYRLGAWNERQKCMSFGS